MSAYDPTHDHLLLFDGMCHLCDSSVRFIIQHDPHGKIKFAPIQSQLGREIYIRNDLDPACPSAMLFTTPRGTFIASDAALEIARTLGGLWLLALLFKPIPRFIRDAAYGFIARHRYRWFGKEDTCMLPTPELRARLVSGE